MKSTIQDQVVLFPRCLSPCPQTNGLHHSPLHPISQRLQFTVIIVFSFIYQAGLCEIVPSLTRLVSSQNKFFQLHFKTLLMSPTPLSILIPTSASFIPIHSSPQKQPKITRWQQSCMMAPRTMLISSSSHTMVSHTRTEITWQIKSERQSTHGITSFHSFYGDN